MQGVNNIGIYVYINNECKGILFTPAIPRIGEEVGFNGEDCTVHKVKYQTRQQSHGNSNVEDIQLHLRVKQRSRGGNI